MPSPSRNLVNELSAAVEKFRAAYVNGFQKVQETINQMNEDFRNNEALQLRLREERSKRAYRAAIAEERRKGREFVKAEAARLRKELGLDG